MLFGAYRNHTHLSNDGVSLDCNDKNPAIHPGAPETPDDKVDSNCNGDDDQ